MFNIFFKSSVLLSETIQEKKSGTTQFPRNAGFQVKVCDVEENMTLGVFEHKKKKKHILRAAAAAAEAG